MTLKAKIVKAYHEAKHRLLLCFAAATHEAKSQPATYGSDPCQGIRDALETQNAATALLQAAVADSQMLADQLALDLTECEQNNQ